MSSVMIRVSPELKDILDNMKDGKTVDGAGYRDRNMKYDDLIKILLDYRRQSLALDLVSNILNGHGRWSDLDYINECIEAFYIYLKHKAEYCNDSWTLDMKFKCDKIIDAIGPYVDSNHPDYYDEEYVCPDDY